jgi:hypothetical protein
MRATQVKEVEETQKEEVKVSITIKEKNEEKAIDTEIKKAGRKKLNEKDKATNRVTLNFTSNEILGMENAMKIEGIEKNNRNATATFIKKMLQRQMLRNGYEF